MVVAGLYMCECGVCVDYCCIYCASYVPWPLCVCVCVCVCVCEREREREIKHSINRGIRLKCRRHLKYEVVIVTFSQPWFRIS